MGNAVMLNKTRKSVPAGDARKEPVLEWFGVVLESLWGGFAKNLDEILDRQLERSMPRSMRKKNEDEDPQSLNLSTPQLLNLSTPQPLNPSPDR